MAHHRGDDLDDDFLPDDSVAFLEEDNASHLADPDDPDDIGNLLSADEHSDPELEPEADIADVQKAAAEKKRKRREKEKERKAKKRKLVESAEPAELPSVAAQPPTAISEYLSAMQAKTFSKLQAVTSITDTTVWTASRSLDKLVDFIVKAVPSLHVRLSQKTKSSGAPTLLFLAGAALRVTDVTRILKSKVLRGEKGGDVAKLFARHFKLEDHVKYLKRTRIGTAVGTPGRIGKLLCETDALSVSALTHIMIDVSFRDAKKRSLLDIPETRDELFKTVFDAPQVREAVKAGKIQVVLF
ncbi:hypothetical protein FA95DRAFT_1581570 [Auriscalpium vulgare]|uniref:Uncharacterized protein n=1 Tax=Auriscalpium vulgare TaxID=40419 RepID=A0ACB8RZE6_9AGAM|nr:hypothetical protein FA95DRAFT_1581570 [Auriscalpium vulgare]